MGNVGIIIYTLCQLYQLDILYSDPSQQVVVVFVQIVIFILVGWLLFKFLFKKYIKIHKE